MRAVVDAVEETSHLTIAALWAIESGDDLDDVASALSLPRRLLDEELAFLAHMRFISFENGKHELLQAGADRLRIWRDVKAFNGEVHQVVADRVTGDFVGDYEQAQPEDAHLSPLVSDRYLQHIVQSSGCLLPLAHQFGLPNWDENRDGELTEGDPAIGSVRISIRVADEQKQPICGVLDLEALTLASEPDGRRLIPILTTISFAKTDNSDNAYMVACHCTGCVWRSSQEPVPPSDRVSAVLELPNQRDEPEMRQLLTAQFHTEAPGKKGVKSNLTIKKTKAICWTPRRTFVEAIRLGEPQR
ncbi:MAG: hypothetical protein V2J20_04765 [Wenzhouxiangella sp.]|jgi:hypothetical protein|nr:hypothetical protein [Wenzhouxiangella sp.]